jgi:3-hydroxyisobutyrate dehydrogenase-like beta-hydroxyacid dehydrogenase
MKPVIAITSPGAMGAAIGGRLTAHGARVLTSLESRSAASRRRAEANGLVAATDQELAAADFLLSIVPPKEAVAVAERLAPSLASALRKPLFVDCNAVSPATAACIGAVIEPTGAAYVDGGIIGGPPRESYTPRLYVSGEQARRALPLNEFGLDVRLVEGGIGTASALKLSYAGINKGVIGLAAAMALAARRAGVEDALFQELSESQHALLTQLTRGVRDMLPKAERWAPEMREIADYARDAAEIYAGLAKLYERLASDFNGEKDATSALDEFFRTARKAAE